MLHQSIILIATATWSQALSLPGQKVLPLPPLPEPIELIKLPLPPVSQSTVTGACTADINPHGTGCIGQTTGLQAGGFLPDGNHVLAHINFVGAPALPDPASVYQGQQVIIVKADGTVFPNGDSWKCITCGAAANNSIVAGQTTTDWSYPQAFRDGKRVLAGIYIIGCGGEELASEACTSGKVTVNPIRLDNKADGSGTGAPLRELRLHPDNVHIGVNSFTVSPAGQLGEDVYYGKLKFNAAPTTGLPLFPRYDLVNVSVLKDGSGSAPVYTKGSEIFVNSSAITVGEFRGFTGSGCEATYVGYSVEACNIDVYAVHLTTGKVRRLTTHPGYTDPIEFSPDDNWFVIQDTRESGRTEFMDGLRWMPPLTDLVTSIACASVRNNGNRRFFQPWLLDRYGDRGDYYGQSLNNGHLGQLGTGKDDDPQWNGQADPWFSPDGTKVVYWQAQAVPPACGGSNPLPCYPSTEPGGADARIYIAHLTSRKPLPLRALPVPFSDTIPWAVPYTAGMQIPAMSVPAAGSYKLKGQVSGYADVEIVENAAKTGIERVDVVLHNYADTFDGILNGYQNITARTKRVTVTSLDWFADITRAGKDFARQYTSPGGFYMSIDALTNIFSANGTLVTQVNGVEYKQPFNGA